MSVSVCLCLCVCLSAIISIRNYTSYLHQLFLSMLPMAVARSSSGAVVICYVLPVLWMTSYLHRRRHQAEAVRLTRSFGLDA